MGENKNCTSITRSIGFAVVGDSKFLQKPLSVQIIAVVKRIKITPD